MTIYGCPNCSRSYQSKLNDKAIIICPHCNMQIFGDVALPVVSCGVPDDWSPLQPGSKGNYNGKPFEITGRVRLQMKDDFRNLWCATYEKGTLWICQSLESLAYSTDSFKMLPENSSVDTLAGGKISFGGKISLQITYLAACLSVSFEGETARFPFPTGEFVFLHASNTSGNTMLLVTNSSSMETAELLWGVTQQVSSTQFENLKKFDGW